LTVVCEDGRTNAGKVCWVCRCSCGTDEEPVEVIVTGSKLVNGHTRSCGCIQREAASKTGQKFKHLLKHPRGDFVRNRIIRRPLSSARTNPTSKKRINERLVHLSLQRLHSTQLPPYVSCIRHGFALTAAEVQRPFRGALFQQQKAQSRFYYACRSFDRNANLPTRYEMDHPTKCRIRNMKNALLANAKCGAKFLRMVHPTGVLLLSIVK
jgi:hypothetical protein